MLLCLGLALLLVGCIDQSDKSKNETIPLDFSYGDVITEECTTDSDCVPNRYCHPSSCVPVDQAPQGEETFCTQECQEGTLDCGGSCGCVNGKCVGSGPFLNK